jgi:hypothetical protein
VDNAKHVSVKKNITNQIQQFVGVQLLRGENVELQFTHNVWEVSVLVARVENQRSTQSEQGKRISPVRIFAQWKTKAELWDVKGWSEERKHRTAHYAVDLCLLWAGGAVDTVEALNELLFLLCLTLSVPPCFGPMATAKTMYIQTSFALQDSSTFDSGKTNRFFVLLLIYSIR